MLPDRVSNPGPLTYESGALPTALRGPAAADDSSVLEINFLASSKYLLLSEKFCSKTNIPGSKNWWPYNSPLAMSDLRPNKIP